jgi:hypothetical protein
LRPAFRLRDRRKRRPGKPGKIAMKHEPQPPIRPRQRGTPGSSTTTNIGQQPKRVVIRVPYVDAGSSPTSAQHTTPEQPAGSASATPSHERTSVATPAAIKSQSLLPETTVERTIRIDAAHDAVPAPHAPTVAAKQSTAWLASALQKRSLFAIGLIISILVLAVVIHQRSGHESGADTVSPHSKFAKSDRHASVARKSQTETVAANGQPWNSQPRRTPSGLTSSPPIVRQSLGTDFNEGPVLLKWEATSTNATANATDAAANAPAALGGNMDNSAVKPELLMPKLPDLNPPREALAPRVNSGAAETEYFGFAPGEGGSAISVATRGSASFEGPISNSPISAPVLKK